MLQQKGFNSNHHSLNKQHVSAFIGPYKDNFPID